MTRSDLSRSPFDDDNCTKDLLSISLIVDIDHGFEVVCSSRVSPAAPRPGGSPGDPLPGDGGGPPEKFIFRRPPPGQISRYSDFGPGPPRPKNPAPGPSRGPPRGPPTRLLETTSKPCSMLCHDHFDQKITTMVRTNYATR